MATRRVHFVAIGFIALLFVALYWVQWPGLLLGGPLKPTLLALAMVITAHLLRVASWPLVALFGLLPFLMTTLELILAPGKPFLGVAPEAQLNRTGIALWSVLFSPITLIGPLIAALVAHPILIRMRASSGD